MQQKNAFLITGCLTVFGLLSSGCAPAVAPTSREPAGATAQLTALTPTPKPAAGAPRYGGIVTRAVNRDPDTFDVHQGQGTPVSNTLFNVYQGLVRLDPLEHAKIVPELAERWEISPDGKTYTFKFYQGVKWHDGSLLSMDDIEYSLARMQKPKEFKTTSPRGEGLLAAMEKVEIAGGDSIKITTKYPSATFLLNLAIGWIAIEPKHILVAKGDMKRDVVGTGPFKLKSYQPDVSLELEKNPSYHIKGLPYLDGIRFYTVKDNATRFSAFRTGRVKITFVGGGGLTAGEAQIVRRDMANEAVVYEHDSLTRYALTFNLAKKPWDDVRARRAVDLAFDKQTAAKVDASGYVGSVYPQPWGAKPDELAKLPGFRQPKDADIAEAKKLMAAAGYAQGFKTTLMSQAGGVYDQQAVVAKDQLAKIGIDAQIMALDGASLVQRRERRDFDLLGFAWADSTGDPDETLRAYYATGGGRNYGAFTDKEIDDLIEKQAQTLDRKAREAILADIERRLLEQSPMVICFWSIFLLVAWNEVKGFQPGPGSQSWGKFDQLWLAK